MRISAPDRLDPVGRPRLLRRRASVRLITVAVLLLTAAAVLYLDAGRPGRPRPHATTVTSPASPATPPTRPTPVDQLPPAHPIADAAGLAPRLPIPDGLVGVPVRLADPAGVAVLQPGDRVDLLAVTPPDPPRSLADQASVLAVDHATAALLLALTPEQGRSVVAVPATTAFTIILRS